MEKSKRGGGIAMERPKKETIGNDSHKRVNGAAIASGSISMDLIVEILLKLPPKSIVKFICVSKLWCSIIRCQSFTDLFSTRSVTLPLFLFTFNRGDNRIFVSVSQEAPYSSYQTSSSITPSRSFTVSTIPKYTISPPICGLICCQIDSNVVISNPSTGQIVNLPRIKTTKKGISSFFGYDPIEDEYKVLVMKTPLSSYIFEPKMSEEHQVFTIGKAQKAWRMIDDIYPHSPVTKGLCSNGVIYYGAITGDRSAMVDGSVMVGFDLRTEEFTFARLPYNLELKDFWSELVFYNKRVALMKQRSSKVEFLVVEDFEKQEWSRINIEVPCYEKLVGNITFYCRGTINSSEFIFVPPFAHPDPFFIIIYDYNKDIARKIEIKGIKEPFNSLEVFLNHVGSLKLL